MQLNSDYYDTDFELTYKGNHILIRNDGPEGESLFVNGELQDQNFSAHNGRLIGHIFDENNEREVLEVILGGKETRDCMIYANGELIHINAPPPELPEILVKSSEDRKGRSKRLSLFFIILLIVLFILFLLPHLNGWRIGTEPQDTNQPEKSIPALAPGPAAVPAAVSNGAVAAADYIEVNYAWNYGNNRWTYSMKIPKAAYEYYKTVDRKKIRDYSYYVTDPSDDEYLAGLAGKFKEAAQAAGYSGLEMVKNVIFFVQSLDYVDDKVGTGYDEYPKFPLETLADKGGDCEDSAILLASLLRELGYGAVLIQFRNHMAVGVKGESSIQGSYYEFEGSRYYYVETTSTGWDIGEVPDVMKDQPAEILPLDR